MVKVSLILIFIVYFATSVGLNNYTNQDLVKKLKYLRVEISSFKIENKDLGIKVESSIKLINKVILNLSKFPNDEVSDDYMQSIHFLYNFSKDINNQTVDVQTEMIDILASDLQLKFKNDKNSLSFMGYSKAVNVEVNVKNKGGIVNNLRIKYHPLGYIVDFSKPSFVFSELSSPTSQYLIPGIYIFWITKDNEIDVLDKIRYSVHPDRINKIDLFIDD